MESDSREPTPAPSPAHPEGTAESPPKKTNLYLLNPPHRLRLSESLYQKATSSFRYKIRRLFSRERPFSRSDAEFLVKYYWPVIRAEYEHVKVLDSRRTTGVDYRYTPKRLLPASTADSIVYGLEDGLRGDNSVRSRNPYGFNIWLILGSVLLRILLEWLFEELIDLWDLEESGA